MLVLEVTDPSKLRVKQMMDAWRAIKSQFVSKVQLRVGLGTMGPNVELTLITTDPAMQGKGHASKAMQQLVSLADQFQVKMSLNPSAIGSEGPNNDALQNWYGKFGFVQSPVEEYYLEREPKGA